MCINFRKDGSNTSDEFIIDKLSEISMLKGKEQQFWVVGTVKISHTLKAINSTIKKDFGGIVNNVRTSMEPAR